MGEVSSAAKSRRSIWPRTTTGRVVLVGIVYFLIGYGSALLDAFTPAAFDFPLRLSAWVLSGITFVAHIWQELFRFRTPTLKTALRVAAAVAIGGFLIATGATTHAFLVQSPAPYWRFALALVVWPLVTAVPGFVVALIVAAVLSRLRIKPAAG